MAKKITLNVISGDLQMDKFLHAADLYEAFKRYGEIWSIELETDAEPKAMLDKLHAALTGNKENPQAVTAIWVANEPAVNYVDWSLKAFGDGRRWIPLDAYLRAFGVVRPVNQQTDGC